RKTYKGGVEALKGVNLQVPRGCIYGLLGPNGAGKSTMVKILTTLIRSSGGSGTILGQPIGDRKVLRRFGLLPEHAQFPNYLTGRQVIEFSAGLQNVPTKETKERTDRLLALVKMEPDQGRKMKTYSKGMKQRIGIAQALVNNPEIVFLDEPTDGVDPAGRRDFREIVKSLRDEGCTVFINTHILSELEPIVDRVAIMSGGEILGEGVLEDLRSQKSGYQIVYAGSLPSASEQQFHAAGFSLGPGVVSIPSTKAEEAQPVIDQLRSDGLVITKVELQSQSLEDLFIGLVDAGSVPTPPVIPQN
ncbi:ABC transporter ATP-binding protein, partial [Akkermansiaceae bacterium]|nr:ABC transporter ATP-binding protein [Akkermansiaceae bacterium]